MKTIRTSHDGIEVIDDEHGDAIWLAKFEGVDRIEGRIEEFDRVVMTPQDLIAVATWLLEKAGERATDLIDSAQEAKNGDT